MPTLLLYLHNQRINANHSLVLPLPAQKWQPFSYTSITSDPMPTLLLYPSYQRKNVNHSLIPPIPGINANPSSLIPPLPAHQYQTFSYTPDTSVPMPTLLLYPRYQRTNAIPSLIPPIPAYQCHPFSYTPDTSAPMPSLLLYPVARGKQRRGISTLQSQTRMGNCPCFYPRVGTVITQVSRIKMSFFNIKYCGNTMLLKN